MNIRIDNVTMNEALRLINREIHKNKKSGATSYVVTPNIDHIIQIEKGGVLKEAYEHASLIFCDGMPLLWISRLYGTPIKEKISGSDLLPKICWLAAKKKYRMFFLGAMPGVAHKAAQNLKQRYPGLNITRTYSPPLGFERDSEIIDEIIEMIKEDSPDILILGLGAPKQEKLIFDYRERMGVPITLCLGASFDFEAGVVKRAPKWMSGHGMEWIYRIIQEPGRLGKRYLNDAICIIPIIMKYKKHPMRLRIKNL